MASWGTADSRYESKFYAAERAARRDASLHTKNCRSMAMQLARNMESGNPATRQRFFKDRNCTKCNRSCQIFADGSRSARWGSTETGIDLRGSRHRFRGQPPPRKGSRHTDQSRAACDGSTAECSFLG